MRFLYDLRTPGERRIPVDERGAMHRAEFRDARRARHDPGPALQHLRPGFSDARHQAQDLGAQVAALQHRVEQLERRLHAVCALPPL